MYVLVGLIGATVIIGGIGVLLYYYARFLANMIIKKEKKRLSLGTLPEKDILKYYKNYNPSGAIVFLFLGGIAYFPMKKAYIEIRSLYEEEAMKRNILLNSK